MLKEVGSIAGVTSLSPATVAMHAPQEGTSTDYTALADAPSALMLLIAAPELFLELPLLADDGLRSVHGMAGQLCEELRGCSRRQAESNQIRQRRRVYRSQCTEREDPQLDGCRSTF